MPRGYRRKRRRNIRRFIALIAAPLLVLFLALIWIWKANMVKDYYATMKKYETEKTNLVSENMRLKAGLMDLKSLSEISKVAIGRLGLTQDVSQRIFLSDPVIREKKESRIQFASEKGLPDWLDTAVMDAGRVMAESLQSPEKGTK